MSTSGRLYYRSLKLLFVYIFNLSFSVFHLVLFLLVLFPGYKTVSSLAVMFEPSRMTITLLV